MKKITLIILCIITLTWMACENDPETPDCLTFEQNPAWEAEAFKTTFSLQFPTNYTGDGFTNYGDFFFHKYRTDNAVTFYWSLCGFAGCEEYGFVPLNSSLPTVIPFEDDVLINNTNSGLGLNIQNDLTEYIEFCENDIPIAVFYYNTNSTADGAFFLKLDDDQLRAALMVRYENTQQQEVESILQTVL